MKTIVEYILESSLTEPKFKPGDIICQKGQKWDDKKSYTSYHIVTDIKDDRYILDNRFEDDEGNPWLIKYINQYVLADDKNKWAFLHWTFSNETDKEIEDYLENLYKKYKDKR